MPEDIDYYKLVSELRNEFEERYALEPTHLIVGTEDYYKMDMSPSLYEKLKYIKDTTQGVVGSILAGMRVIKSSNMKGIKVGLLL